MKIIVKGQIIDVEENLESMKQALITHEEEELKNIGCDGNEANEMAYESVHFLSENDIIKLIKNLEIK